jgi:hypothetical protein
LQSAGPVDVLGADDDGGCDVLGAAEEAEGLGELVPGAVVPCGCGWPAPQAESNSAAAAAAVVIKNPCEMR